MQNLDEAIQLDPKLIEAIIQSTCKVFSTMLGMEVICKAVEPWEWYRPKGEISAFIGIFGSQGEGGMLATSFSVKLAARLVSQMMGISAKDLEPEELCDGVRELVNMISGGAKAMMSHDDNKLYNLSLPAVVLGHGHEIFNRPTSTPYALLKFFTPDGEKFDIQVAFKNKD